MASAAAGGAAQGGLNPHPNPSRDGGPRLQSPPGKGNKPAALADITNTGRPNATRAIVVADVVKENAKLLHLLTEKTKIIDLSRVEMQKLRLALQASRNQNLQLAQTNSQMLAELNMGKERIKTLQHELSCTTALLKVKDSEIRKKNKADPQDAAKKRGRNKLNSGSSECVKDINIMQESYKPHLEPIISLGHEDLRKPQRRRSSRLNQGSCEISRVSHKKLLVDTVAPFAPSILSVQKQHEPTTGKDMGKSLQNEQGAIVHEVVIASESEEINVNEQLQQEVNKDIQEACFKVSGVEAHKTDDKACNTEQNHIVESQSSTSFDITESPKPPEDNGIKRGSNKQKLASCASANFSAIKDDPSRHEKKRKSARLNSISSDDTNTTFEALHEDVIAPLAPSSSNASVEQRTNQKHGDTCFSRKSTDVQVAGRRSLRRAAEKVVSYKEIPLNVKMRRP